MSAILDKGIAFAKNGWAVFPVLPKDKKPATPHGFKDASHDLKLVKKWFSKSDLNIAIATGKVSKLAVIDIDPRNGGLESFEILRSEMGLDTDTVTVETGGGGFHLYYLTTVPVKSKSGILPGIDIKGDGGYVVAPPSMHPNGKHYFFVGSEDPSRLKTFPYDLVARLGLPKTSSTGEEKINEGGRHDYLVRRMAVLRGLGLERETIVAQLRNENQNVCNPPLDDSEVDSIINSTPERSVEETLLFAPQTDLGNAERFKAMYQGEAVFVSKKEKWFIFDGKRYVEDSGQRIIQLAKGLLRRCKDMARSVEDEARGAFLNHIRRSESNSKIIAMLKLAQSEMPVAPEDLDRDPYFLNVKNGTLDLRTGKIKLHDRSDKITKIVPIDFDPNAKCPTFTNFLLEVCNGDVELCKYLQKVIGYSLTGNTKEQNLWILYGLGSNGKTTFIDIIKRVSGEYGRTADISTFTYKQSEQIRNDLARLFDARLVTSVEIQEGKLLDESVIKQVTGGDPVTSRFLFKEHFEYIPKWKLFMVVNHLPHINGTDRGIWRRIKVIPFTVSFEGKQKDKDLLLKLEKELSGILNWAIEGCLLWRREGLSEPNCVLAAGEKYQRDEDSIEDFISENTEKGPEFKVRSMDLFKRYSEIQREHGMKVMSQKLFAQKITIKGYEKKRDSKGRVEYLGLRLKSHPGSEVC